MSNDKYPRVIRGTQWVPFTAPAEDAAYKVVPADALVIERSDLPEVDPNIGGTGADVGGYFYYMFDTIEQHERAARAHLALAEYLRANPPVDQAQVDALAHIIAAVRKGQDVTPNDLADRILRHGGVRVEVTR